jgi:hypothetical protein
MVIIMPVSHILVSCSSRIPIRSFIIPVLDFFALFVSLYNFILEFTSMQKGKNSSTHLNAYLCIKVNYTCTKGNGQVDFTKLRHVADEDHKTHYLHKTRDRSSDHNSYKSVNTYIGYVL